MGLQVDGTMVAVYLKVKENCILFFLSALCFLPEAVALTKTSNACYSSGGDCGFHFLSCDSGFVISLRAVSYGFKAPEVYAGNQCELALTDCANYISRQSCCQYETRTDCLRTFSFAHLGRVKEDCEGKAGCSFHATRVSGGCQKPPVVYDKVSSYSVINYDCVHEIETGATQTTNLITPSRPATSRFTETQSTTAIFSCDGCTTSRETTEEEAKDRERQRTENMLQLIVGVSVGVGSGIIALVIIAAVCWIRIRRKPPETAPSSLRNGGGPTASSMSAARRHSSHRRTANSNTTSSSLPSSLYSSFFYSDTIPSSHPDSLYATPAEVGSGNSSFGRQSRGSAAAVLNYGIDGEAEPRSVVRNYGYEDEAEPHSVRNYGFEAEEEQRFNRNHNQHTDRKYGPKSDEKPYALGSNDFEYGVEEPSSVVVRPAGDPSQDMAASLKVKSSRPSGRRSLIDVDTSLRSEERKAAPEQMADEAKKETKKVFPKAADSLKSEAEGRSDSLNTVSGFPVSYATSSPSGNAEDTSGAATAVNGASFAPHLRQPPRDAPLSARNRSGSVGHRASQAPPAYRKETVSDDARRRDSGHASHARNQHNQPIRDPVGNNRHNHEPPILDTVTKYRQPLQLPILDPIANAAPWPQRNPANNSAEPPPPPPPPRQYWRMSRESESGPSSFPVYALPDKTRREPDPAKIRADIQYPAVQPTQATPFFPWSKDGHSQESNGGSGLLVGMTSSVTTPRWKGATNGAEARVRGNLNGANVSREPDNHTDLPKYNWLPISQPPAAGKKNSVDVHQDRRGYFRIGFGNDDTIL